METSSLSPSAIDKFQEAVREHLNPLAKELKLDFEQIDPRLFLLASESVAVKVYFPECHGYDVDITFAPVSSREWYSDQEKSCYWVSPFLGLGELASWRATSEQQILDLVKVKVDFLRQALPLPLLANQNFWRDLSHFIQDQIAKENEQEQQWLEEQHLTEIRHAIDSAWKSKDYPQVISLFEKMKEKMTAAESKKLEYARKHVV